MPQIDDFRYDMIRLVWIGRESSLNTLLATLKLLLIIFKYKWSRSARWITLNNNNTNSKDRNEGVVVQIISINYAGLDYYRSDHSQLPAAL